MQNDPQSLHAVFQNPQPQHYPGVYWFWHHIPEPQEIEQQLQEIKSAGYHTFFIQARLAFPRHQYLSLGYLQAYRYAMRMAKKLELTAGLYDDYNWVSGHAGGRTVEGHDHLRERHLFWSSADAQVGTAQCTISSIHNNLGEGLGGAFQTWCYEGGMRWGAWDIYAVFALPDNEHPVFLEAGSHYRLADSGADGCVITVDLPAALSPDCRVVAFASARCLTSRLINYLHPEAAQRFIAAGYEPYRRALEDYFGDPLKFLFFDQPYAGFYTWREHFGNPRNSLMFDETLEAVFEERRGYPLAQALLALVLPETRETAKLVCDFFDTYGELARSGFLAPVSDWAQQAGLALAGHELLSFVGGWGFCEGLPDLDARVNFGGDTFAVDGFKTISAVDACNYHPQISARFGASTARMWGRKGCMLEQYSVPVGRDLPAPAGQWDLTLDALRSQAIRHLLFGASQFIFHAYYQTNTRDEAATPLASPRFDFPPGINYEPWFRFHPRFAAELARLAAFLDRAASRNRVAVLYPLRTYWYGGAEHPFAAQSAFWNRWLSERGIGFDIIDERQVYAQNERNTALSDYSVLVLPGVSVVKDASFADALQAFVSSGNRVLSSGPIPDRTQASGRDDALYARICRLFEDHPNTLRYDDWLDAQQDEALFDRVSRAGGDLLRIEALDQPEMPLWTWQGVLEGRPAAALFNDSLSARQVRLTWEDAECVPERFLPHSGEAHRWGWFTHKEGCQEMVLPLKPRELVCLRWVRAGGETMPRLVEIQGASHAAARVGDAGLDLQMDCFAPGALRLLLRSQKVPEVVPAAAAARVHELEADLWQVDIDIPALPPSISLEKGWRLRIPGQYRDRPADIQTGWEMEYPEYIGAGFYRNDFALTEEDLSFGWVMRFPHVSTALTGYINQNLAGTCGWPPYELELPHDCLKRSYNHIELAVWNTAGNAFYHDTPYGRGELQSAGLAGVPELVPFVRVQIVCKHN